MADTVTLDPGAGGAVVATDDLGATGHVQLVKLMDGTDNGTGRIAGDATNGLDVDVTRVQGSVTVIDGGSSISVDDNGGSLTVDGSVTVSDGGGSLTVDNGGTFAVQADTELTTADLDTGAGTDTRAVVGLALAASGGALLVGAANPVPVSDNGGSLTVDGTVAVSGTVAVTDNAGSLTVDNGGTFAIQDSEKIADDAAFTVGTTKVMPVGYLADQSATDSVNEGDIGAARMTLDRKQITTAAPSVDTEGASIAMNIDVDETEDAVKASAGKILGWYIYNDGTSEAYVKFYDASVATVVVGTTTTVLTIPIPAGSAANVSFADMGGIPFATAITIAATTGVTTADTGAPSTNQVIANILYI